MVEAHQQHGPKVASFQMVAVGRHWYVVGCDLPHGDTSTIECVIADIRQKPRLTVLLITRDFNTNISNLKVHACDK